jgi:hypothetical protein
VDLPTGPTAKIADNVVFAAALLDGESERRTSGGCARSLRNTLIKYERAELQRRRALLMWVKNPPCRNESWKNKKILSGSRFELDFLSAAAASPFQKLGSLASI